MHKELMKSSRPPILTVFIVAGLVGCFLKMFMVISPAAHSVAHWYPLYLSLSTTYETICLGGLGFMKKWAVLAYSGYAVANQLVYLALGNWNAYALVPSLAITMVSWIYFRRMN